MDWIGGNCNLSFVTSARYFSVYRHGQFSYLAPGVEGGGPLVMCLLVAVERAGDNAKKVTIVNVPSDGRHLFPFPFPPVLDAGCNPVPQWQILCDFRI